MGKNSTLNPKSLKSEELLGQFQDFTDPSEEVYYNIQSIVNNTSSTNPRSNLDSYSNPNPNFYRNPDIYEEATEGNIGRAHSLFYNSWANESISKHIFTENINSSLDNQNPLEDITTHDMKNTIKSNGDLLNTTSKKKIIQNNSAKNQKLFESPKKTNFYNSRNFSKDDSQISQNFDTKMTNKNLYLKLLYSKGGKSSYLVSSKDKYDGLGCSKKDYHLKKKKTEKRAGIPPEMENSCLTSKSENAIKKFCKNNVASMLSDSKGYKDLSALEAYNNNKHKIGTKTCLSYTKNNSRESGDKIYSNLIKNANSKKNKRTLSSDTSSCKNRKLNGRGERPVKYSTKRETIGSSEKQTIDVGRDGPKEMPGSCVIIKKSKKEDFARTDKNIVTLINKKNNFLKNDQIQLSHDFLSGSFCGSLRTPKEV